MKKIWRRWRAIAFLGWVLLIAACQRQAGEPEPHSPNDARGELTVTVEQQEAIGLTTTSVVVQTVRPVIESFGRVIPRMQGRVSISSPVAGRVLTPGAAALPTPGAPVRKGQLLAEVEQTVTAAERVQFDVAGEGAAGAGQEAKAALNAAAAEYQRSQNLLQAKVVSRKRVEEAEAAWRQAQSRYETARRQESSYRAAQTASRVSARRFSLTTPIDGIVVQADLTAGQQVDVNTPLFTVVDLSTVWVEAPVFEGDLDKIDTKSPATIRRGGETLVSQQSWMGAPLYAGVVVDPVKRTANLLYEVKNEDGQLKLGMSVMAALPAGPEQPVLMVPETAVLETGGGKGVVYIQQEASVFAEKEVTLGVHREGLVAITGEVQEGEKIVVTGAAELFGKGPGRLPKEED
jgi:cobalt-zinc-cadmium efflux system membrane fusion protein